MALGETYNNNEGKYWRPTVYGYSMSNTESEIDVTKLAYSMWGGTLKIAIQPKIDDSKNEYPKFDFKNAAVIHLNHTKARIFADILKAFIINPVEHNEHGVFAGQGLLTICNGERFGKKDTPILVIEKIGEGGTVESSYAYEFKRNYHCAIKNFNEKSGDFEKVYEPYDNIEILEMITQLEAYYNAMTGSIAFSVVDNMARLAATDLGMELKQQRQQKSSGSSYFANSNRGGASSRKSSTIDDIMGDDGE